MNRRFFAYLLAAAAVDSGYWIAQIAQGWLGVKLTISPVWLGLVAAATEVPFLLFSLAGGDLADRFDRRRLIALGNLALFVIAVVTAVLVATGAITIWLLAVLGFLAGTVIALEHPIDRAWIYDLVAGDRIGRAIALSSLEWATARTVGPAIGGAAIATIGIAAGYGAYALAALPMILLAMLVRTHTTVPTGAAPSPADAQRNDRSIVVFSAFTAVFTIGITPYQALLPEIAKNAFGQSAAGFGVMAAAGGIGAIGGAAALAWRGDVAHKGRLAVAAAFIAAVLLVVFTRTHALVPATALLVVMGAIDTLMYALSNTYVQQIAGEGERGRANAIFSLAFLGGIPLGSAALGLLAGRVGSQAALGWSGTFVAVAAVVFWVAAPRARDAA
jgi:MFS family permease